MQKSSDHFMVMRKFAIKIRALRMEKSSFTIDLRKVHDLNLKRFFIKVFHNGCPPRSAAIMSLNTEWSKLGSKSTQFLLN